MAVEISNSYPASGLGSGRGAISDQNNLTWKRQLEKNCFQLDDGRLDVADPKADAVQIACAGPDITAGPEDVRSAAVIAASGAAEQTGIQPADGFHFISSCARPVTGSWRVPGFALPTESPASPVKTASVARDRSVAWSPLGGDIPSSLIRPANVLVTETATERCIYIRDFFSVTKDLLDWVDAELDRQWDGGGLPLRVFVNGKEYALHQGKLIREETNHVN